MLKTRWFDQVDRDCPLPEYPRPQLRRGDWLCLNGRWDYAITGKTWTVPQSFDGEIIVPFAPECAAFRRKPSGAVDKSAIHTYNT